MRNPIQDVWLAGQDDEEDDDQDNEFADLTHVCVFSTYYTILIYSCKVFGSNSEGGNTPEDDIYIPGTSCIHVSILFVLNYLITLFRV